MKPDEYYQKQIDHYTARLKQIKKRRNLITLAKLLTFGYMIFLIYLLINHSTQPLLLLGIGAILVFIFLTLWDSQIIYRQHLIEELLRINTLESDYLAGNFSAPRPRQKGSTILPTLMPMTWTYSGKIPSSSI